MYGGTSSSTLAISLGTKYLSTQAGLDYQEGARVRLTYDDDNTKWMEGVVQSYYGTNMTIKMDLVNGSGTFSDWLLNIAGEPGSGSSTGIQIGVTDVAGGSEGDILTVDGVGKLNNGISFSLEAV